MRATLLLAGYASVARAQEPAAECVLDSDCSKGRCIDLVCVEQPAPPSGSAAPKGPPPNAPPRQETKPETPSESTASPESAEEPPRVTEPKPTEERPAARPIEATPERPAARPRRTFPEEDVGVDEDATAKPGKVWYGAPLIATYAATELVGAVTLSSKSDATLLVLSLFASPSVHWANKKVGKGFLSLLMQPVFAGAGALIFGADRSSTSGSTWIAGAAVGLATWAVIDIAAIAYKDRPKPERASFEIVPFRAAGGGGAEVIGVW